MCRRLQPVVLLLGALASSPAAGQVAPSAGDLDSRFSEDQRVEVDTPLGRVSVGVSGLSENEQLKSTLGDLELGYLYQHELDSVFPRVAELRPFLFNRAETTDTALYESLGVGAGVRLSLRKKYEQRNWFIRLSGLTPTDAYRERYALDPDRSTVVEVFGGYEVPFSGPATERALRQRVAGPSVVRLRVPAALFDSARPIDAEIRRQIHAMMVQAYLVRVNQQQGTDRDASEPADRPWPVLDLIGRVTGEELNPAQWMLLEDDRPIDPQQHAEDRRALLSDYLRLGLTQMMRDRYPLMIESVGEAPAGAGQPGMRVVMMSRPGMNLSPKQRMLDADTMIQDYIATILALFD